MSELTAPLPLLSFCSLSVPWIDPGSALPLSYSPRPFYFKLGDRVSLHCGVYLPNCDPLASAPHIAWPPCLATLLLSLHHI